MNLGKSVAVASAMAAIGDATTGVDVSQGISKSTWQCLQSPGGQGPVKFAIPRVHTSGGSVDNTGIGSIIAANQAGVAHVDGYIFPCVSCGNPSGQVTTTASALRKAGAKFGMLWLDVEPYRWSSTLSTNQQFIEGLISGCASAGVKCGVYTNWNSWGQIVGNSWTYAHGKGLPVWYPHYDKHPSFTDFQPFGGWTSPAIKQYIGDASSCSVGVDYNWYPGSAAEFYASMGVNVTEAFDLEQRATSGNSTA